MGKDSELNETERKRRKRTRNYECSMLPTNFYQTVPKNVRGKRKQRRQVHHLSHVALTHFLRLGIVTREAWSRSGWEACSRRDQNDWRDIERDP